MFFGDDVLKSKEGCQQGCSLGTLLYILSSLSIIPVIETLQGEFPSCTLLGSVDGYYIMGPPEDAAKCLRRYSYGGLLEARDQRLNFSR